jgi:aspartyl-tRNA(Asn)/glutamyl-tRNA(Gln) amidotransferase subunit A
MKFPDGWKEYFDTWEEKIGAFIQARPQHDADTSALAAAVAPAVASASAVAGLPFAVKDNIAVKDFSLSCGSRLLENFVSPYTATAVKKLCDAGAAVIGKTNMDEFGMGSSTDLSALKQTNNPWDASRVAGGSSGGSAAAVAAGIVPFALGSDTGGSVRQPAAFCGVTGLKPTWGAVSRFGLVAYASSLETIGVFADSVERCRAVFEIIKGSDPMDQTSRDAPDAAAAAGSGTAGKLIGVLSPESVAKAIAGGSEAADGSIKEAAAAAALSPEIQKGFEAAQETLKSIGYTLVPVEIPALKYGVPAYYTIAAAEASANLARFDGIRYGKRPDWAENPEQLIDKARTLGFGEEVKLRILLGTFVLRSGFQDKYYHRAQKIRSAIRLNFEKYLGEMSAILMPVFPTQAFGHAGTAAPALSKFAQKAADLYTCCANLAGLPALAFPAASVGGLPSGVQLLGRAFGENALFDIAGAYEKAAPFAHPAGWKNFW